MFRTLSSCNIYEEDKRFNESKAKEMVFLWYLQFYNNKMLFDINIVLDELLKYVVKYETRK